MTAGIRHQRYCRKALFSLINAWLKNHLGDFYLDNRYQCMMMVLYQIIKQQHDIRR
jgi:hypothetical protein